MCFSTSRNTLSSHCGGHLENDQLYFWLREGSRGKIRPLHRWLPASCENGNELKTRLNRWFIIIVVEVKGKQTNSQDVGLVYYFLKRRDRSLVLSRHLSVIYFASKWTYQKCYSSGTIVIWKYTFFYLAFKHLYVGYNFSTIILFSGVIMLLHLRNLFPCYVF